MRCDICHKDISMQFPDIQYNAWLKLMFYFEHELTESKITETTYNQMVDCLMSVKSTLVQEQDNPPKEEK